MSAPNQGRQSPEPERQAESQVKQTSNPNPQGSDKAGEESKEQLSNLSSNPTGPLEKESEKKTSKN